MGSKIVRYKREDIPRMTSEEVAALKARLDDPSFVIDTSDIAILTEEQWKNSPRRGFRQTAGQQDVGNPAAKEETPRPA